MSLTEEKNTFRLTAKKILKRNLTNNPNTLSKYLTEIVNAHNVFVNAVYKKYILLEETAIDDKKILTDAISYVRDIFTKCIHKLGYDFKFSKNAFEIVAEDKLQNFNESESEEKTDTEDEDMTTKSEFLKEASKLIPSFDGNPDNLLSFIDALELVNDDVGNHMDTAIRLIKTKLTGKARNCISDDDNTILKIITRLKAKVQGESSKLLTGKLLNLKQNSKSANTYVDEIQKLTESLKTAFITEGLTSDLADQYSTDQAVRAMKQNANNDKVKLVMESGQFHNLNEAVSKFISASNDVGITGSVFFMSNNRGNYRGRRRGHSYYRGNHGNYNNRGRGKPQNSQYRGNSRGNYRGRNNYYNQNRQVRYYDNDQGNDTSPRPIQMGDLPQLLDRPHNN